MSSDKSLSSQTCESCAGLPSLTTEEVDKFLKDPEIKGWVLANDGTPRINKTFKFESAGRHKGWTGEERKAWRKSTDFVNKAFDLMEEEDHHASVLSVPAQYGGSVNVVLTTHAVNGLSRNDFRMASKLNKLYEEVNFEK